MPPSKTTQASTAPSSRSASSPLVRYYLAAYNLVCVALWTTCTLRTFLLVPILAPRGHLPAIFTHVFSPLLTVTQTLAVLEILHSLIGIVRAPFFTTFLQVASRLLLVWGVMFLFRDQGNGGIVGGDYEGAGKGLTQGPGAKVGDFAFLGCMGAWGITEIIRYGFFALQVLGVRVPSWWMWLRYNTFFVLYPIGISSECILIFKALEPAAELNPLYKWFLIANLVIYVPGSYILYTHMMAQRRRVLRGKKRVD
ncbi:hypothetical protein DTO212C5_3252 [Paecilomyces variotii]|nr:hypothetical protein DTO212C5_3252 [Paecilomyces variotii]